MMTHFEGPIVDSVYDMALTVWHNAFDPPLPCHNSPAAQGGISCFSNQTKPQTEKGVGERLPELTSHDPHYDPDIASEAARVQCAVSPSANETRVQAVTRHLSQLIVYLFIPPDRH
jgi:hypothetical protein